MVSVPRKYREQEENGAAVAATTPVATPEPPAEPKPAEPVEQPQASDPVRAAEQSAIAARLAEMERAEQLARQPINQPPPQHPVEPQEPPSAEQIIASSRLPDQAKDWLRQRPELVLDPIKNDQLQKAHDLAAAQTGEEFTDSYFNRMDHLLGFRQETKPNGSSNGHAAPTLPSVPSRPTAPIRQQQHAAPVSAPPTRQAPSMGGPRRDW